MESDGDAGDHKLLHVFLALSHLGIAACEVYTSLAGLQAHDGEGAGCQRVAQQLNGGLVHTQAAHCLAGIGCNHHLRGVVHSLYSTIANIGCSCNTHNFSVDFMVVNR